MLLQQIYDDSLSQYAYLIGCPKSGEAVLVDPERDIDRYLKLASDNDLAITAVAETHIHADYLSGVREFLDHDSKVEAYLSGVTNDDDWRYNWAEDHDRVTLLKDGDRFAIGNVTLVARHTPGHTPEHLMFLVYDLGVTDCKAEPFCALTGDFVFVGSLGRPDLLDTAAGEKGTSKDAAKDLYSSLDAFGEIPEFTLVLPAHGAGSSCGKALGSIPFTSAGYENRFNDLIVTASEKGQDSFVEEILDGQSEPPMYFARMKEQNRDGIPPLGDLIRPPKLDSSEAQSLAENSGPDGPMVLDTRSDRRDFMDTHLKHSLHAPLGSKFSEAAGSYVKPENEIYLVVSSENDVEKAVRQLVRIGLDDVKGYFLWPELAADSNLKSSIGSIKTKETSEIDPGKDHVLDVRSKDEYEEDHIPDAVNVPHTRLRADSGDLPQQNGNAWTVHCGSGVRAALASSYLGRLGYDVIYADGDYENWKK
ncbi:MAG: MBL fold metallo-hydrolase [Verrucomicrobiales bacterium]|nr:MBL fold metallo-hydrolase [Verrucomicrobiales bacterium]